MLKNNNIKPMILEFKKKFPYPNLYIYKNHKEVYEITLIGLHLAELDRGYKIAEIGKPTNSGIELTFKPFLNKEDVRNYLLKIKKMMEEFNIKNKI